jgi:hypothetical protein
MLHHRRPYHRGLHHILYRGRSRRLSILTRKRACIHTYINVHSAKLLRSLSAVSALWKLHKGARTIRRSQQNAEEYITLTHSRRLKNTPSHFHADIYSKEVLALRCLDFNIHMHIRTHTPHTYTRTHEHAHRGLAHRD